MAEGTKDTVSAFWMEERLRRTIASVILDIASKHKLTPQKMLNGGRATLYSHPRQEAMFRAFVECPHASLPAIGRAFGGRDHTTILHGIRSHGARIGVTYKEAKAMRAGRAVQDLKWKRSLSIPPTLSDYRAASSLGYTHAI